MRNRGAGDSAIAEKDRQFLIDIFRSGVHQVESLLGWDCGDWLDEAEGAPVVWPALELHMAWNTVFSTTCLRFSGLRSK